MQRDDLRLVDRARERHQVAERRARRARSSARSVATASGASPAAARGEPAREVKWCSVTNAVEAVLGERPEHAPVVLERGAAELARRGLDARPLERQPVGVLAERGQQREVLRRSGGTGRSRRRRARAAVVPGACSQAHQSLLTLPPSTWWAAVEEPNRKPSGNVALRRRWRPWRARRGRPLRAAPRPCRSAPT